MRLRCQNSVYWEKAKKTGTILFPQLSVNRFERQKIPSKCPIITMWSLTGPYLFSCNTTDDTK